MGFTVVGKLAATAMTSSPGRMARSPSLADVNAAKATRFADEPELTVIACGTPTNAARRDSNSVLKRPVVSHASSDASTMLVTSGVPTTLPLDGIGVCPGTNIGARSCVSAAYADANIVTVARSTRSKDAGSTTPAYAKCCTGTVVMRDGCAQSDAPSSTAISPPTSTRIPSSIESAGDDGRLTGAIVQTSSAARMTTPYADPLALPDAVVMRTMSPGVRTVSAEGVERFSMASNFSMPARPRSTRSAIRLSDAC